MAAYFGKRVALVERAPNLGGAGLNTGTVPSKTLRETALYFSGFRQRGLYGIDLRVKALASDKPIILHELLHAYHDRMLPGGFGNTDVAQFFVSASGFGRAIPT
jgi:hypothetical protein